MEQLAKVTDQHRTRAGLAPRPPARPPGLVVAAASCGLGYQTDRLHYRVNATRPPPDSANSSSEVGEEAEAVFPSVTALSTR